MTTDAFQALVNSGVVLLDGATGSNLRKTGMPVGVSGELWALEHPEPVLQLQRAYVRAGSRILFAPTFTANRAGLALHGLEERLEELNTGLVALSKRAAAESAGAPVYVAGDVTTTGRPLGALSYEALFDIYAEQIGVLAAAGADLIVVETMMGIDETAAALDAAHAMCDLPVMCSFSVESDGGLLFSGSITDAVEVLQEMGASAVGVNCSAGPDQLEAVVRIMCGVSRVPVIAKPNAGMPVMDEHGAAHYGMTPERFVSAMQRLIACGASIVGGCCGTDPSYIRALAAALRLLPSSAKEQ